MDLTLNKQVMAPSNIAEICTHVTCITSLNNFEIIAIIQHELLTLEFLVHTENCIKEDTKEKEKKRGQFVQVKFG